MLPAGPRGQGAGGGGGSSSSYTTVGKRDESCGTRGHWNSEQESGIPCAVKPDLRPTPLQHTETGSSHTLEKAHACGYA